ncbi:hemoglobin/transferrin/lactoferrin receptor protein [Sphingobium sp. YR657]|uniref:TonB-dependent receptor n=1 Tax=Sphingobium TaxID=165695 RepID=UPI00092000E8|nr:MULTISPECIES: TonB-dependent receptor [Sphingobium]SHM70713.1 hemoglobin/transferrin/lactoferrin receptor protein [Sphingobium sp. YR657]
MTIIHASSLRALALCLAAGQALPLTAQAQAAATQQFDIAAGPLGAAIARLGRQAGIVVAVDPALVRNKQSKGLRGAYATEQALGRLLAPAGLRAQSDGRGGYRVISDPATPAVPRASYQATSLGYAPSSATAPVPLDDGEAEASITVVGALTDVEIDEKQIEFRQVNNLSDLFRQVPSVTVGGSLGIAQKIYVRGLEDSMLNVTVDGAPQRGTLFHHIGRVSIEPELLKTVDVKAGAGEATSGFGAIGGAIRFQTRDADDLLLPGQSLGGMAKAGWFSNDGYKLSGTLYAKLVGDVGIIGSYTYVDRDNMEDGAGNELYGTAATQNLGFVKVGGDLGGGHRFSLSYEQRNEKASFGQRPNWPVLAGDPLFPAKGKRQTATLNYGYSPADGIDLEATGYWTRSRFIQDRYDRWGLYGATIRSAGFDTRARFRQAGHDLIVGAEYRDDKVSSEYLEDVSVWGDWAWDASVGQFEEKGSVFALYAQDHWKIIDPLTLSYGLRYDAYDLTQVTYRDGTASEGVSWNAGLRYEILDGLALSGSFAEAFRGKEIGDAFTLERRPGRISLQPDLRPERVDNIEAGASFERGGLKLSAVWYDMRIKDVILDQIGNGPFPQAPNYHENVGKFKAKGVELRAGYASGPFSIEAYFNHYRSRLNGDLIEGYEHIGLGTSVGDNWNVTAGYKPSPSLGFEVSVTHYNDLNDIEVLQRNVEIGWADTTQFVDKPGYTVVDMFGRWQPFGTERLTLFAGVYNLFDVNYRAHASVADYTAIPDFEGVVGVREPGRDIRLTASVRF